MCRISKLPASMTAAARTRMIRAAAVWPRDHMLASEA